LRELIDREVEWVLSRGWISWQGPITSFGPRQETGGQEYFPRFQGEVAGLFQEIHQALRNQYVNHVISPETRLMERAPSAKIKKWKTSVKHATNEPLLPVNKTEKGGKPV